MAGFLGSNLAFRKTRNINESYHRGRRISIEHLSKTPIYIDISADLRSHEISQVT